MDQDELGNRGSKGLAKIHPRALREALDNKADPVPNDAAVLVLLAAVDKATTEDLAAGADSGTVDGVEDLEVIAEQGELARLAVAPLVGIGIATGLALFVQIQQGQLKVVAVRVKRVTCGGNTCGGLCKRRSERVGKEVERVRQGGREQCGRRGVTRKDRPGRRRCLRRAGVVAARPGSDGVGRSARGRSLRN